jgi:ketosteroid isomerase-like protein
MQQDARTQLVEVISRYFAAVDDKRLNAQVVEQTFLEDARIVRPNGAALTGHREILESQQESFARFRATHHVITDHVVDLEHDTATVRANVTAMHLWRPEESDPNALESYFLAGSVLQGAAAHQSGRWRILELSVRNVWRTGSGFASMLKTR